MITSCVRTRDGALRLDAPIEELRHALADPDALIWIDILAEARDHGEAVLRDVFGFHPLTIDDCYNTLIDPPKVDHYPDYLFVIVHAVQYRDGDLSASELDMFIGGNYVVTVHRSPLTAIAEVRRRAEHQSLVLDRGAAFLAHAIFDVAVDEFHPVVERLEDEVEAIQETVVEQPEHDVLQEVLRLKRHGQRLKRSILPQRDVANRFARGEYAPLVSGDSLMYFRDIYDHTVRVEEMIDSVRDLMDSALNTYLSAVNNRINNVMKALTIVAVIFLPLTLIASVYGTNFEHVFPAYGWIGGFYGMVGTFVIVAGLLVGWFRWRGWI